MVERRQLGCRPAAFRRSSIASDAFVEALARHGVCYVVAGSAAAALHGVSVEPRDFDVVPDTAPENLRRLAAVLADLGARPHFDPGWAFTQEECDAWTPHPPTEENLDHLYDTRHGLFDVVPSRAGRYEALAARAVRLGGVPVAAVDDLIAELRLDQPKHRSRLTALETLKEPRGSEGSPA